MNSMRKPGKSVKGFSRFFRYLDNGFSLPLSVMKFLYSYQNIKWLSSEKGNKKAQGFISLCLCCNMR